LAKDPQYADVLQEMRTRLSARVKDLPDLSMYPESHLVDEAFENPVAFGQQHKQHIAELVDIADLSLRPFAAVRSDIERALRSDDRWHRYWGLCVCSSFGEVAMPFFELAKQLADSDEENMVRMRAAEFLALHANVDPSTTIMETLNNAKHGVEANVILNTLVLLRDGKHKYTFDVPRDFAKPKPGMAEVERRLLYLHGELKR